MVAVAGRRLKGIMNDEETLKRFIFMRAEGHSFNSISVQLKVSKPTLIKWSRQHEFEIRNLRATHTEELAEVVFKPKHERWRSLAKQLALVEEEIAKRDMEEMTRRVCSLWPPACAPKSIARSVPSALRRPPRKFRTTSSWSTLTNGKVDR